MTTEQLLQEIFDDAREGLRDELPADEYERRRWEFGFHLADCRDDIRKPSEIMENSDQRDEAETTTFVMGALLHMVPHLKAAARLLWDEFPDPFDQPAKST
jgi:hypothetical protein